MASRVAHSTFLFLKRLAEGNRISPQNFICSGRYLLKLESGPHKRSEQKNCLVYSRKNKIVKAVAVSVPSSPADNAEDRKQLSENYGFRQIGEPLPDNVTLKDIVDTLPRKVFEIDDVKAWKSVLISVTSYALGIFMIAKAPWYLLPLAWAFTGTAITGDMIVPTSHSQETKWWKTSLELWPSFH